MAGQLKKPLHRVELVHGVDLYYEDILTLDLDFEGEQAYAITPEKAREMKSIIDLYLYSLYVNEANI